MKKEQGGFYHVFNRGVDKRNIFMDEQDFVRFLLSMREFRTSRPIGSLYLKSKASDALDLVEIVAYCLNSNHYHLILRQNMEKGIARYMHKLSMGYTNYVNAKYKRSGSLFQGKYKNCYLESESKLWQTSFYVNGNTEIHGLGEADKWPWSSCLDYLGLRAGSLCQKNLILNDFSSADEYRKLLFDYIRIKKAWKEEMLF